MDGEPLPDTLEVALREALREHHAGYPAPPFDAQWAVARTRASGPEPGPPARVHSGGFARRTGWALGTAALAALAWGLLTMVTPPDRQQRIVDPAARPPALDPTRVALWYAQTDPLLHVSSLSYGATPARLTSYDPITMEVKP